MRKVFVLFGFVLCSCSSKLLVPFEEEKVCNKGVGYGYCGRVSDLYEDTLKRPHRYGIKEGSR